MAKPIAPYSPAVCVDNQLFVSGQIALDPANGNLVVDNGIAVETTVVMNNLKAVVEAAGFTMADVVKCSIFMNSMDHYAAVNEVYGQFFSAPYPAREAVAVKTLPANVNVEISCIAVK